ncbi:CCA tRNA nucleotidyltransferase [Campylobacter californiensis]|uniref:CCA tRNA nucleotidyltransferase n=1 Tax=Campylobacter californiensis TaxID=1032243 RepID=UPI0014757F59|nr:CCA tRNA nucleotidyltransferase [Campylobacter sp. RM12916]MBE3610026.1 CCA tRNA nucleotidyltransferase [Campylobacter sp. RM12916]
MLKTGLKIYQNKALDEVREILAPHTSRAYLVGGCVRDSILGREIYDYDIEVYDISPDKFDNIMQDVGASGVGKSYFIYKFKEFDLGLPRTENKTGLRHTDFEVSYCNDEKAASQRRDFSINALMLNIFNGELIDNWSGLSDLRNSSIRHIDDEKFCEDPLRVLRAVQFASRLNFKISQKTLELMKTLDLSWLSKDRIACELLKFFKAKHLEVGTFYLYELGLFDKLFNLKISRDELDDFCKKLQNARKFIDSSKLFLYLLSNEFSLNLTQILKELKLPKIYEKILKEPFYKDQPSDFEFLQIAQNLPLKQWLGCYSQKRVDRAKKLGYYDEQLEIKIDAASIIQQGFTGKAVGEQIELKKNEEIEKILAEKGLNKSKFDKIQD